VHDVRADDVKHLELDCILFQSRRNYLIDQFEILSSEQIDVPRIYLEHEPPAGNPSETRHPVDDPNMLLVHVTHYNNLMWNSGRTPTRVIEHGVLVPEDARYTGELERGLSVVNHLSTRGRALGGDIFDLVRKVVPLDLVAMGARQSNGVGELSHADLPYFEAKYRFFFSPIRYCSMALAMCEAMMIGLPVIGLATTEMVNVIENGVSGYIDTDINQLVPYMYELLAYPRLAQRLSEGARRCARERFNIERFVRDWDATFEMMAEGMTLMPIPSARMRMTGERL
jgi:glycosyltransferase involved in cell wall biosynthesis